MQFIITLTTIKATAVAQILAYFFFKPHLGLRFCNGYYIIFSSFKRAFKLSLTLLNL